MRLTPRQLQNPHPPTPRSQWSGVWDPQSPNSPSNSEGGWNVDACTILLHPLNPLSGIPEGSIDSIDRGSLRGDPLGLDRSID